MTQKYRLRGGVNIFRDANGPYQITIAGIKKLWLIDAELFDKIFEPVPDELELRKPKSTEHALDAANYFGLTKDNGDE